VNQFLDTGANKRTDQWGGSVENRCRFGLEAIKVLIEVWGAGRVGIKMNPCGGYNDVGYVLLLQYLPRLVDLTRPQHVSA
jgi:2,4-dienoyl-CoA reductase-like NADH-dependent reductase (Old Yellow Enzyme family)